MPETIHQSKPIARKVHICDVCLCAIEPGTRYIRSFNRMDDVYTFVEHEDCQRVGCKSLEWWDDGDGYNSETVEEWLTEHRLVLTDEQRAVLDRIERGRLERRARLEAK